MPTETWYWTPPTGQLAGQQTPLSGATQYWNVKTFGGSRMGIPTLRGQNIEIPYANGQQNRPKFADSRTLSFVMWTAAINQGTGQPDTADQLGTFNDNLKQLRQLFWNPGINGSQQGVLTRNWWITWSGSRQMVSAQALGEVAGSMDPAMTGRYRADFTVDILLADPFFYGATQTQTIAAGATGTVTNLGDDVVGNGQPQSVSAFTAKLTGPLTNPVQLQNVTTGALVQYGATIATGHFVTLDMLNYTATDDGGANQGSNVSHSGSRAWFGLLPGANTVKLLTGNGGDTGSVLLTWTPPYI